MFLICFPSKNQLDFITYKTEALNIRNGELEILLLNIKVIFMNINVNYLNHLLFAS